MLLEFEEGVEDSKVELGVVGVHEHFDLLLEDEVLEGVLDVALLNVPEHHVGVADVFEHLLLHVHVLHEFDHFLEAFHLQQGLLLVRLQEADARDEVFLGHGVFKQQPVLHELQRHAVGFEAKHRLHLAGSLAAELLGKHEEVLNPEFLEDHAHDLGVLLVHKLEDLLDVGEGVFLLDACNVDVEVLGQGSVGEHGLVNESVVGILHLHQLLELGDEAHRVSSLKQEFGVSLVLEPVDDVDHVVDHLGDLAHLQESSQGFLRIRDEEVPFVLKLGGDLGAHDVYSQVLHYFAHEVLLIRVGQEGFDVAQCFRVLELFVLLRFNKRNH